MCDEKQIKVIPSKTCKCCGRTLPLTEFKGHGRSADGHKHVCKACEFESNGGNSDLKKFTPRELIEELAFRGYHGELKYTEVKIIKV